MAKQVNRVLLPKAAKGKAKSLEIVKAFPLPSVGTIIGEDLNKQVGRPVAGLLIKSAEGKKVLEEAKKALESGEIDSLLLTLGVCGKDIILLATGKGWEKFGILVAGYTDIIEKEKAPKTGVVVNLDPKDPKKVIPTAAANVAKKLNTTPVLEKDVGDKLVGITGDIVLLAHGGEDKTSTGQIYCTSLAGKDASYIIKLLTKNPDAKKRLTPDYSGTVYLDGCFTAQGGAMKNYTKLVWDGLKSAGIKNVKVMGNLGAAATTAEGEEIINPTIEAAEYKKKLAVIEKKYKGPMDACLTRMKEIAKDCQKKGTKTADIPEFKLMMDKKVELANQFEAEKQKLLAKAPVDVKNLVGKFGVSTIN